MRCSSWTRWASISRITDRAAGELEDDYFDLVISLSPEAQHRAVELTRDRATELEFWNMSDRWTTGSRERVLDAYRDVRDELMRRIRGRFPPDPGLASD